MHIGAVQQPVEMCWGSCQKIRPPGVLQEKIIV